MILILGGARSGKSGFAVKLAERSSKEVVFLATAQASDEEMRARIKKHQKRRPRHWKTLEIKGAGIDADLTSALENLSPTTGILIIDDIGVYLSNLFMEKEIFGEELEPQLEEEINDHFQEIIEIISTLKCEVIVVSNEVGLGLVPPYISGRLFRDILGLVNQKLAKVATKVYLMIAGVQLELKRGE